MNRTLKRDTGFAAVSLLALTAPVLGWATVLPFLAIAGAAAFLIEEGPAFELFARPRDWQSGRLYGLAAFALSAAVLAFLAAPPPAVAATYTMPLPAFAASVVTVGVGTLGATALRERVDEAFIIISAFAVAGFVAALLAQMLVVALGNSPVGVGSVDAVGLPTVTFHAALAALVGALTRSLLSADDRAAATFAVGASMLVIGALSQPVHMVDVGLALGVALFLGIVTYATGTASVEGMLSGVLLCLVTIVLGGPGWFALLLTFFGLGTLSTKFRYEDKAQRGVAEENEGARGLGNVLGNAAIALLAVVGFAAAGDLPVDPDLFRVAFAGSLAAAMGDTLSSEIGGLFDKPRLVTTGERVPPGTDGGVTWQGELAGLVGAALVGVLASMLLAVSAPMPWLVAIVAAGGLAGMTVDSLLGATVEGDRIENETVNLLATLAGALASVLLLLLA
ncbi:DUF92 domain-containing protein [Halolamina salifodinae]|uniref:Uncharacterized protein (TIGR00297 family) n=1 Tax=Halolamina salifodinae TaxID=1202767 RepID=A0A8T4GU57_9EURY|nr:DUF92 domain-containing protein [Halolamina salifodinae]MBP1985672.1 uncharacterized protein (TIGR00297 family) [Halolamina salifodinae]